MTVNLEELEKLERKATKGPWRARPDGSIAQTSHVTREVRSIPRVEADAFLVAALRNAAPALFQELRELRAFFSDCSGAKIKAERDALRAENTRQEKRLREVTQKIVEAIGAAGPESLEDALEGLLTELSSTRAEVEGLKAAYWKGRAIMGFDNDGAEKCDVVDVPAMIVSECAEMRSDLAEAYAESDRLEAQLATAREDALEEAAMTAGQWVCPDDYCDHRECVSAEEIESAIRALKTTKGTT